MIIHKYGITLRTLKEEHIEEVRHYRNLPEIRNNMIHREIITRDKQKKWFDSINNECNIYFIIEYHGEYIGLTNAKDIDWDCRTAEGGIFVWKKEIAGTPIPILISWISLQFFFDLLNFSVSRIKIIDSNYKALKYNSEFGYELHKNEDGVSYYKLTADRYSSIKPNIINIVRTLKVEGGSLEWNDVRFEPGDELWKDYC